MVEKNASPGVIKKTKILASIINKTFAVFMINLIPFYCNEWCYYYSPDLICQVVYEKTMIN